MPAEPPDQAAPESVPEFLTGPIVEHSVTVPVTRDVAWTLLTTPQGIRGWYTAGGGAEVDLTVGRPLSLWWEADSAFLGTVVTVEPPRRFDYRLAQTPNTSPQVTESTLVQFLITEDTADPTHSVVAVRESGFDKLTASKEAFTASSLAWVGALGMLQQLAQRLAG